MLARILFPAITFLLIASGSTTLAQTIRYGSAHWPTAANHERTALPLPKGDHANGSRSMIVSVINGLKAVFKPGSLPTPPEFVPKHKHRNPWAFSIVPALDRGGWPALPPLLASSQVSTNKSGGLPPTFDGFLKQNAANEKSSEAAQTTWILVIVLLVAMALAGRWLLRR
ncbi:MAG: hypothetical protein P4N60_00240 [Verrucomicrobiae bacterium]|nr:hypothetical protein [Verrucomicrobiae bacterium]